MRARAGERTQGTGRLVRKSSPDGFEGKAAGLHKGKARLIAGPFEFGLSNPS
jgi:hypothetical protein